MARHALLSTDSVSRRFYRDPWGWDRFFPHRVALSSLRHPYSTRPSQALSTHQTARPRAARISRTHPRRPILESAYGRWSQNTGRSHPGLSIDTLCATHRKSHRHIYGLAPVSYTHLTLPTIYS